MRLRTDRPVRSFSLRALALVLAAAAACSPPPPPSPAPAPLVLHVASAPVVDAAPPPDAASPEPVWPYASPVTVRSAKGMVVSDNALATKVGRDVLAEGGNAADAAVATAFALAVTYPTAGNLGGGGFAVTRFGDKSLKALDFRETAPAAARRDMYVDATGKPTKASGEGILSAGVPGSVAGLAELHKVLGSKKKPWAALLAPAIALARDGFVVDAAFVETVTRATERLTKHPASAALFLPEGKPPALGSTFRKDRKSVV